MRVVADILQAAPHLPQTTPASWATDCLPYLCWILYLEWEGEGWRKWECGGRRGTLSSAFKFQIILLLLAKIIEILVRKHFFTCCRCFLLVVAFVVVAFSACKSLIINFLINFYTAGKLLQRVSMRQVFRLWINVIFILFTFFFSCTLLSFLFSYFFSRCACVCVCLWPLRGLFVWQALQSLMNF